jgi:hypothetical protein
MVQVSHLSNTRAINSFCTEWAMYLFKKICYPALLECFPLCMSKLIRILFNDMTVFDYHIQNLKLIF